MADRQELLRSSADAIARIALVAGVAFAIAATIRYGLIERDDLGALCESADAPGWCGFRLLVIRAFLNDVFGLSAAGLAVLAVLRRSGLAAVLAVAVGTVGMVLYGFAWSGVGALGGALVIARLHSQWQKDAGSEQQAGHAPAE